MTKQQHPPQPEVIEISRKDAQTACNQHLTALVAAYFFRPQGDGTYTLCACNTLKGAIKDWNVPSDGPVYSIVKKEKE